MTNVAQVTLQVYHLPDALPERVAQFKTRPFQGLPMLAGSIQGAALGSAGGFGLAKLRHLANCAGVVSLEPNKPEEAEATGCLTFAALGNENDLEGFAVLIRTYVDHPELALPEIRGPVAGPHSRGKATGSS